LVVLQAIEQSIQESADKLDSALRFAMAAFIHEPQLPGDLDLHFDLCLRAQGDFQVIPKDSRASSPRSLSDVRGHGDSRPLQLCGESESLFCRQGGTKRIDISYEMYRLLPHDEIAEG
jgi:hypothetical protein